MTESQQAQSDTVVKERMPEPIMRDAAKAEQAMEYLGILNPVLDQVKRDKNIRDQIAACLTMNPEQLDGLSLKQMDRFLVLLPKALIWLQECENLARIAYEDALGAYEDTIQTKASLLDKKEFDVSQISAPMRLAKIKEKFPNEFHVRTKELRTRKAILLRLDNQTKHLERFNDNLKKIRESQVVKLKSEKE